MQNKQLEVQYHLTDSLIPYENNARSHDEKQINQIAKSIETFGFTAPILINDSKQILAGHGRLVAAMQLGHESVPTITISQLSEDQQKAYILADNKIAINATWDESLLKMELIGLNEIDFDLSVIGFSDDDLDDLLAPVVDFDLSDANNAPDVPEVSISETGDLWIMGNHRVLCGDSTSIDDVNVLMKEDEADLLVTDPPYNVEYTGKTKDALTIENDAMDDSSFRSFLRDAFVAADNAMRPGASFYIWHADSEGYNFRGACRDAGWQVRQCLIWSKNHMVMGRQDYHWKHEPCLYGWKDGAAHTWASDRTQTTILEFERPSRNQEHPTMKPVDLIEYLIGNNSHGRNIVLDLFGGSGTTLIASEMLGRSCRMMELDPRYVDVIVKRWQRITGNEARTENGKTMPMDHDDGGA